MKKDDIKKEFIEALPIELKNKFSNIYFSILDEGIEKMLNGESTYNGRMAETKEERFILLGSYLSTAITALNGMFKGVLKIYPKCTVNINYRGNTYTYDFPRIPLPIV